MKDFKSLFRDSSYLKNPVGTWQNAKNILMTKQFNSPVNENGTKFNHLINGLVRGCIETNREIVYFVKTVGAEAGLYNSKISIVNVETSVVTDVLKGNFNFERPIEGIYSYDHKNNLIVVWCDGVYDNSNTPKIAKVIGIDLPVDVDGVLDNTYLDLLELFPDINQGIVEAEPIDGNIEGLYAFVTFAYCYKDEVLGYKPLNTYSFLNEKKEDVLELLPKGIRVKLSNLNNNVYDSIKVGLYIIGGESDSSYETEKIVINNDYLELDLTSLATLKPIANETLLLPKDRFEKIESIALHKDRILGLNVDKYKSFKFQKYANLLKLAPVTLKKEELKSKKFLCPDEVYAFYIQLELHNGELTEWFHIPNLDYEDEDLNHYWELNSEHRFDLNRFEQSQDFRRFHFENKGDLTRFGFWQNKETYPDNEEYNSTVDYEGNPLGGQDLRNTGIKFHRIGTEQNPFEYDAEQIPNFNHFNRIVGGAAITNFDVIPLEIRTKIKNIRLGVAKRDAGNSLILTNGLMIPVNEVIGLNEGVITSTNDDTTPSKLTLEKVDSTPFYSVHTAKSSDDYDQSGYSFNRGLLLSSELEKFKPRINFNVTLVKGIQIHKWNNNKKKYEVNDTILYNDEKGKLNKYYQNFYSYDYKLPNNSSQGSTFTDGGLYINYDTKTIYYEGTENEEEYFMSVIKNEHSFLPLNYADDGIGNYHTRTHLPQIPLDRQAKFIDVDVDIKPIAAVSLLNIKDNLYSLNANSIISSINTKRVEDNILSFYLGDVGVSEVRGSLAHYSKWKITETGTTVYLTALQLDFFKIKEKIVSPIVQSTLEIKGDSEPDKTISLENLDLDIEKLNTLEYGYEVKASEKMTTVNDLAQYETFNIKNNYVQNFPFRIIRSNVKPNEGYITNAFRTFFANAYYELTNNKGDGVAIRANDSMVYIQLRNELYLAQLKDVLSTENADTYLADGDIFDREPRPVTLDKKGYIGSEHKFACKMTKDGYITIDHKKGNIALVNEDAELISNKGIRNWLLENLEYDISYYENVNGIMKPIDDPYSGIGFVIGFDPTYKRLFFTKLYPLEVSNENIDKSVYNQKIIGKLLTNINLPYYKDNKKSFTYSYSLDTTDWLAEHDLKGFAYITINNKMYALRTYNDNAQALNSTTSHLFNIGNKGEYFGIKHKSYIDIIFNAQNDVSKSYEALEILTEVHNQVNAVNSNKTISSVVLFNHHQCSGEIILDLNNFDIIRQAEGVFRVNNFRDLVIDADLPIILEDGSINISNLDFNKNWFDMSYFISKFIVVRVIWDNDNNDDIYLNEVKTIAQISKR